MQFRHEIKVHTIQTTDQGRWKEDDVNDCKYLDDLILFDIYQTEEGILEVVQTVKTETGVIEERIDILNNHRQTLIEFFREEIAFQDI